MSLVTMGMASPMQAGLLTRGMGNCTVTPPTPPSPTPGWVGGGGGGGGGGIYYDDFLVRVIPEYDGVKTFSIKSNRDGTGTVTSLLSDIKDTIFVSPHETRNIDADFESKYNIQDDIIAELKRELKEKDAKIKVLKNIINNNVLSNLLPVISEYKCKVPEYKVDIPTMNIPDKKSETSEAPKTKRPRPKQEPISLPDGFRLLTTFGGFLLMGGIAVLGAIVVYKIAKYIISVLPK